MKSKKLFLSAAFLLCTTFSAFTQTDEISSNDISSISGGGDTLWISTLKGLDFTTDAGADTVLWEHISDEILPVAFGAGRMLGVPINSYTQNANKLWLYVHDGNRKTISTGYDTDIKYTDTTVANFQTQDAIWSSGFFWIASADGGLLRVDSMGNEEIAFYPGLNKQANPSHQYPEEQFPDSTRTVLGVAADHRGDLWVASHRGFWHLSVSDTVWTKIPDISSTARYLSSEVNRYSDSSTVYAAAVTQSGKTTDTSFYRLSITETDSTWEKVLIYSPELVSFAPGNRLFSVYDNSVRLHQDQGSGQLKELTEGRTFLNALLDASDTRTTVRDIAFFTTQTDTFFWVATDQGLFLSQNPFDKTPVFTHFFREFKVESGLTEAYAAPGIINSTNPSTVFVYKIDGRDRATVDIYDWNMDHVIQIKHPAGSSEQPTWDGTRNNNGGKAVAPGVYYFKIHTKEGKRAFGKVVVALTK